MAEKLLEIKILDQVGLSINLEDFCKIHQNKNLDGIEEIMGTIHREIDLIVKPLIIRTLDEH